MHQNLATGAWQKLTLSQQIANIGSEFFRALSSKNRADQETQDQSALRGLELIDLTIAGLRSTSSLKELLRLREVFCDLFFGLNQYKTSTKALEDYFLQFAYIARL